MPIQFARISGVKDYLLTAFILVLSITLLVGRNQSGIDTLRKVSVTLFSYLEVPLSNIRVYRLALETNTELRKQNTLLLDKLNRMRSAIERNDELLAMLQFSRADSLSLYPVQIVGKSLNRINNVITIDAGSRDGIEKGMPMISANGLIGKVVLAAPHYAQVMPYLHSLFRVSAKLQTSNAYGIVRPNGDNIQELVLQYIPKTVPVDTGEIVVTSGYSNRFPAHIPIGSVIRSEPEKGKETKRIYIDPFVNLFRIAEGFIVISQPDTTLTKLNEHYKQMF